MLVSVNFTVSGICSDLVALSGIPNVVAVFLGPWGGSNHNRRPWQKLWTLSNTII